MLTFAIFFIKLSKLLSHRERERQKKIEHEIEKIIGKQLMEEPSSFHVGAEGGRMCVNGW